MLMFIRSGDIAVMRISGLYTSRLLISAEHSECLILAYPLYIYQVKRLRL